jgi:hypothetical protein
LLFNTSEGSISKPPLSRMLSAASTGGWVATPEWVSVATQPPVLAADGILDRGGLLIEPSLVLNNKQTNS